jgi:serine/threonine protein kinase
MSLFTIQSEFRYEILQLVHEGTMGAVYEAEQHGAQDFVKTIAIKIIRPSFAGQPQFIDNFIGEAKLVADLIHTNIVQTYHLGESSRLLYAKLGSSATVLNRYMTPGAQVYFMAMELIRGVNLEQFLRKLAFKKQPLPIELAVFIISRVARGLAYAHSKRSTDGQPMGIVHRDVSPKNIMIAYEGDVKLIDFGIAKARGFLSANEGDEVTGKPEYMSPEQTDFKVTDKRADIFSAGVVLAELLLGYNLFRGQATVTARERILSLALPDFAKLRPGIDERLNQILHRSLARDPQKRYPTANEFLHDLEYHIYHQGYGPTNETLGKFIRKLFDQVELDEETEPAAATVAM